MKNGTFYKRKEKLLLPAINIPSNLLIARQGQSLTLIKDFSRNRKEKLDPSVCLPHKIKNLVFSCQQPNQDCSRIQTISTIWFMCFSPITHRSIQHTNLIMRLMEQVSVFAAHHVVYFTLSCVALLLHRTPRLLTLPVYHQQIYFYYFTLCHFKHSSFTEKRQIQRTL